MNRCENCRFLGAAREYRPPYHSCERIEHDKDGDFATVMDYEGYDATLLVRKDFGCALFEAGKIDG
jgi:hypothetical protein